MLSKCTFLKADVGDVWVQGTYSVTFRYRTDLTIERISKALKREGFKAVAVDSKDRWCTGYRQRDGVLQTLNATRIQKGDETRAQGGGIRVGRSVTISLEESPTGEVRPVRWYRGAIAERPPVPLIDVPFLPGVRCESVQFQSLKSLLSSRGIMFHDRDAIVFGATVKQGADRVRQTLEEWAGKNGYRKTPSGGYFKPGPGVFEIYVRPIERKGNGAASITLYTSKRDVRSPIAWSKI